MVLDAKNKFSFVDGTIDAPETKSSLFSQWRRENNLVKSWLINYVAPDIASSLMFVETETEIWNELEGRFTTTTAPRIYEIKRAFTNLGSKILPLQHITLL